MCSGLDLSSNWQAFCAGGDLKGGTGKEGAFNAAMRAPVVACCGSDRDAMYPM